jgi:hypothetical protein
LTQNYFTYTSFFKVVVVNIQKIKTKILDYSAFSKAKVTASYFDSHKTNFTEIDLIPVESKQLNTPFYQSVRNLKGITPTNNPISNDLKQMNETAYTIYNYSSITNSFFCVWLRQLVIHS